MQGSWSFILLELEVRSPETARGQTPLCHVGVYVLDPRHAESTQKTNVKLNKGLLNDAQLECPKLGEAGGGGRTGRASRSWISRRSGGWKVEWRSEVAGSKRPVGSR
uniref:Uncharacterized protein n=1 Tax=Nothobranchius furzeri TaxID=105023 RepID=A0A1A7ZEY3_NOTFU